MSYNHPFGATFGPPLPIDRQEAARVRVAKQLIHGRAARADILEVGYPVRGGVTLDRHQSVWDACSRNAIFLTGTGVSDNHGGGNWRTQPLNYLTMAWAADNTMPALLAALAAGRVYFADPLRYTGTIDLALDGAVPMGGVVVDSSPTHTLAITATEVPAGGAVTLVQGVCDLAGPTRPDPINVMTVLPATLFPVGRHSVAVGTPSACYLRVTVQDSAGTTLALSNPIWVLRSPPLGGIPASRSAAGGLRIGQRPAAGR